MGLCPLEVNVGPLQYLGAVIEPVVNYMSVASPDQGRGVGVLKSQDTLEQGETCRGVG